MVRCALPSSGSQPPTTGRCGAPRTRTLTVTCRRVHFVTAGVASAGTRPRLRQPAHKTMGWFSGQSKAAKELERKRQLEKDEENAKKADDVCEEQKTPYQKKVRPVVESHAIDFMAIARRRGSFLFHRNAPRRSTSPRTSCASRSSGPRTCWRWTRSCLGRGRRRPTPSLA